MQPQRDRRSTNDATMVATGIHRHPTQQSWLLVTEKSAYALGVTDEGILLNLYWGARLASFAGLPAPQMAQGRGSQEPGLTLTREEYPAFGGLRFGEIAAKAIFADQTRDIDLRFADAEIGEQNGLPLKDSGQGRLDAATSSPPAWAEPERSSLAGGIERSESATAQVGHADHVPGNESASQALSLRQLNGMPELRIRLRDAVYPLLVTLTYRLDSANDLIIRSAQFTNTGSDVIVLERAFSAAWHLPRQFVPRHLTTLAGQWAAETRIQRQEIVTGTVMLESRKGITGTNTYPWFALDTRASEKQGDVYFGTLAWSGNWTLHITTDAIGATTIVGGIHDYDFAWRLAGNTSFDTPDFVAGFTQEGMNGVRHRLHRYVREQVLPRPQSEAPRPVLYNSWEATFFDVTEEGQSRLAERAAALGVELFVVDDGWFPGRNNDHAGLGDWRVDPQKFPHGLRALVERVNNLGMQFGLWVEPEMVNPDSDLYRAHPDWIYYFPRRPRSESRQQLVLNVGRQDVQEYLLNILDQLIRENGISFIKWDMNRPIAEPGWSEYVEQGGEAREIWVRHTLGVYAIMDGLRARHPELSIESCSSGGGRADLGILRRTDQIWSSDNTHPDARLFIQEGISHILPGRVMGDWVTDTPHDRLVNEIPLRYRFHVAMMGMLGIGGHLLHWSEEDLAEAAHWIAIYKTIRHLVQDGDQYWLLSPTSSEGNVAAVECRAADASEAVVFVFRRSNPFWEPLPPLRLQGLQASTLYQVKELGSEDARESTYSGSALMNLGIELSLQRSSYVSCILYIRSL